MDQYDENTTTDQSDGTGVPLGGDLRDPNARGTNSSSRLPFLTFAKDWNREYQELVAEATVFEDAERESELYGIFLPASPGRAQFLSLVFQK